MRTTGNARAAKDLPDGKGNGMPQDAFDEWLRRGLQDLYSPIAQETIPQALLDMIEEDRNRGKATPTRSDEDH